MVVILLFILALDVIVKTGEKVILKQNRTVVTSESNGETEPF